MSLAFCASRKCDPTQRKSTGVQKHDVLGAKFCPDCGSALIWLTRKSKYRPGTTFYGIGGKFREKRKDLRNEVLDLNEIAKMEKT